MFFPAIIGYGVLLAIVTPLLYLLVVAFAQLWITIRAFVNDTDEWQPNPIVDLTIRWTGGDPAVRKERFDSTLRYEQLGGKLEPRFVAVPIGLGSIVGSILMLTLASFFWMLTIPLVILVGILYFIRSRKRKNKANKPEGE